MRTLIIVAMLLASCSSKGKLKNSIIYRAKQKVEKDTLKVKIDAVDHYIKYLGFIDKFYFSKKNETYIELYFLEIIAI